MRGAFRIGRFLSRSTRWRGSSWARTDFSLSELEIQNFFQLTDRSTKDLPPYLGGTIDLLDMFEEVRPTSDRSDPSSACARNVVGALVVNTIFGPVQRRRGWQLWPR
jgi:hypothetical protein